MPYHKINSLFKRNTKGELIDGDWSIPEFGFLANNNWTFTEKVDGTNIRVIYKNGQLSFGGRYDNSDIPSKLLMRLEEIFMPHKKTFSGLCDDVVFYGEGYGAGIQNGHIYRPDMGFVLFDAEASCVWLTRQDVEEVARQFELDVVPVIGEGTLSDMINLISTGPQSKWGPFRVEGIVARPAVELKTRRCERIITKLKCRDVIVKSFADEIAESVSS